MEMGERERTKAMRKEGEGGGNELMLCLTDRRACVF